MIGETILHYKILEKLGEGGMGIIYLAEDTKLERKVALKFLPKHVYDSPEDIARFKTEAKAAAALNHPNIATIYNIEEADNEMFLVMEYIKGIELSEKIKCGIIPSDEAIKSAKQIADGLENAHKAGIIHRDIKSSNIMITESGNVKIMDFGIAKIKGGPKVTQLGTTVGTVDYMSPEQSRGDEVDSRTDIWSLGIVLYEMLTGKVPFRGDYNQAIIYSILNDEPEPVSGIDTGLQKVISKALAKKPEDRYQSAGEIAEELHVIIEGGRIKNALMHSKLMWMIASAIIILITVAIFLFRNSSENIKMMDTAQTIAVLPFVDMSQLKDQEYFSDGISEELINVLSKNPKLRVTARTSSFSFKGKDVNMKNIAQTLNVKHILEGSVRKSGNALRISANLINVETDATLWSNSYDVIMENIFALQDSISHSVAEALNAALLGKEKSAPQQKTTPEAYNAYLHGIHFLNLQDKENLEKATSYFEQALSFDPRYAPAWVGLGWAHANRADYGYMSTGEGYGKARQEVQKALDINPNLPYAYSLMGWIKKNYDWEWNGADAYFRKGLELEPSNAGFLVEAGALAFTLGRYAEAITLTRRSIELDPINIIGYNNIGHFGCCTGSFYEGETAYRKCLELNPQFPGAHVSIGYIYLSKGKLDSAMAEMLKETEPILQKYGLAIVYHKLGKKKEADDLLVVLIKEYHSVFAYQIAEIYAYRGETDKSFEWLERAYNQRDAGLTGLISDPLLNNIRKDPRYTQFMKKMNLPI